MSYKTYFKVLYWFILCRVLCEKSTTVSFDPLIMINNVVFAFPSVSKILVKLICCIAFGTASDCCCLLKYIAILF